MLPKSMHVKNKYESQSMNGNGHQEMMDTDGIYTPPTLKHEFNFDQNN